MIVVEIIELTNNFLKLGNIGGSVANEDLLAIEVLVKKIWPSHEVEADGNNDNPKVACKGKEISVSTEVPSNPVKKGGNREAEGKPKQTQMTYRHH